MKVIQTFVFGALVAGVACSGYGRPMPHRGGPGPVHRGPVHHGPVHHVVHHPAPHGYLGWRRGPIHAHHRSCWLNGVWYDASGYAYYAPAGYVYQPTVVAPPVVQPAVVAPAVVQPAVVAPAVVQPTVVQPAVVQPTVIRTY